MSSEQEMKLIAELNKSPSIDPHQHMLGPCLQRASQTLKNDVAIA